MGIKNWSNLKDVKQHEQLFGSSSLTKGTEGCQTTAAYLGKIFENFTNTVHLKFARILNLFSTGKWVNNATVYADLRDRISEMAQNADKVGIGSDDRLEIQKGIGEMRQVCDLLKVRKGVVEKGGSKNINGLEKTLQELEKKVKPGEVDIKLVNREKRLEKTEVNRLLGSHVKVLEPAELTRGDIVPVIKNRLQALIRDAQKHEDFTETLGQWRGENSTENRKLKELLESDLSKLSDEDLLKEVKEGVRLIGKGYTKAFREVPSEVLDDIQDLKACFKYLKKVEIKDKTAAFNEKHPAQGLKERVVEDLPSKRPSMVHVDREVPAAHAAPITKEGAKRDKEFFQLINHKKAQLQEKIRELVDMFMIDPQSEKLLEASEKLQLAALLTKDMQHLSRREIKRAFNETIELMRSTYYSGDTPMNENEIPMFLGEFPKDFKKMLAELKSLENERSRYRTTVDMPIGKHEKAALKRAETKPMEQALHHALKEAMSAGVFTGDAAAEQRVQHLHEISFKEMNRSEMIEYMEKPSI